MQIDLPETTSKIGGPLVRQFSVFLPNKVGAMLQIVKLLNAHATHVVALSISESTDAAIARIIVKRSRPRPGVVHDHNIAFGVSELMVVELRGRHPVHQNPFHPADGRSKCTLQLSASYPA